jgi:Flp pilus assembly protein TadG
MLMKDFGNRARSRSGQACYLIGIAIVPIALAFGAFSADTMHLVAARNELQGAVDSGALAGAYRLASSSPAVAMQYATSVTAQNSVEKVPVSNSSPGTTVTVSTTPGTATKPATVTVTATRRLRLMFSSIFSHQLETVTASATAGGAGGLAETAAGEVFPLAVSIDAIGSYTAQPLSQLTVGQQIILDLGANKDQVACSTGLTAGAANANYFKDAMDEALGINQISSPPTVPPVSVGDSISLNNGNGGFHRMMGDPEYSALMNQPIICPIIEGGAPFNQSRQVIGFVGLKITSMVKVTGAPVLTCTIVKPVVRGRSAGADYTGAYNAQVAALSPTVVHLIR